MGKKPKINDVLYGMVNLAFYCIPLVLCRVILERFYEEVAMAFYCITLYLLLSTHDWNPLKTWKLKINSHMKL